MKVFAAIVVLVAVADAAAVVTAPVCWRVCMDNKPPCPSHYVSYSVVCAGLSLFDAEGSSCWSRSPLHRASHSLNIPVSTAPRDDVARMLEGFY